MANYRKIKGKNYHRDLLAIADKSVSGKGDGRISTDDAKTLLESIKDSNTYTDVEKRTVDYIRDNFKFTEAAETFFKAELRKWESTKKLALSSATTVAKKSSPAPKAAPTKPVSSAEKKPTDKPSSTSISQDPSVEKVKSFPWWIILVLALLFILFIMYRFGFITSKNSLNDNPPAKKAEEIVAPAKKAVQPEILAQVEMKKEDVAKLKYSFSKRTTDLTPETKSSLNSLADFLKKNPATKLQIIGHSCDLGTEESNKAVSVKRAEKVKAYLKLKGIKASRLIATGKGESESVAPNDIEENRQKNRRVEFKLE